MLSIRHNNYPDYLYKLEVLQHFGKSNNEKNECVSALTTAQFPLYNIISNCKLRMSDMMRREMSEHKQQGPASKKLPIELISFPAMPLF